MKLFRTKNDSNKDYFTVDLLILILHVEDPTNRNHFHYKFLNMKYAN
jgi:hypothetical protein